MKQIKVVLLAAVMFLALAALHPIIAADASAPNFTLKDMDGNKVKLSKVLEDHELVMIDFWFLGCKPCVEYMEYFDGLEEKFGERGFKIFAINTDSSQKAGKAKPFIRGRKWAFTVLLDPTGEVRKRYQVKAEPTTFLINKDRKIVYRHQGYKKGVEKEVEKAIDENLPE
ncbi:TlpA family protein disulfide reductase [bacterium]|nr:TlpA family protein disulfide reductase [bacterium]